jgi:hypothetical protein
LKIQISHEIKNTDHDKIFELASLMPNAVDEYECVQGE